LYWIVGSTRLPINESSDATINDEPYHGTILGYIVLAVSTSIDSPAVLEVKQLTRL
jgi:hypothetical protein